MKIGRRFSIEQDLLVKPDTAWYFDASWFQHPDYLNTVSTSHKRFTSFEVETKVMAAIDLSPASVGSLLRGLRSSRSDSKLQTLRLARLEMSLRHNVDVVVRWMGSKATSLQDATDGVVLSILLPMRYFRSNQKVQNAGCVMLCRLLVLSSMLVGENANDSFLFQSLDDLCGNQYLFVMMGRHPGNPMIQIPSLCALEKVFEEKSQFKINGKFFNYHRDLLRQLHGVDLLLRIMRHHQDSYKIQKQLCSLLQMLVEETNMHSALCNFSLVTRELLQTLRIHSGCATIANAILWVLLCIPDKPMVLSLIQPDAVLQLAQQHATNCDVLLKSFRLLDCYYNHTCPTESHIRQLIAILDKVHPAMITFGLGTINSAFGTRKMFGQEMSLETTKQALVFCMWAMDHQRADHDLASMGLLALVYHRNSKEIIDVIGENKKHLATLASAMKTDGENEDICSPMILQVLETIVIECEASHQLLWQVNIIPRVLNVMCNNGGTEMVQQRGCQIISILIDHSNEQQREHGNEDLDILNLPLATRILAMAVAKFSSNPIIGKEGAISAFFLKRRMDQLLRVKESLRFQDID